MPTSRSMQAAGATATVYGRLYSQPLVFSSTLASTSLTGGLLATPSDASHFAVGQLANVWLDCATLRGLPNHTPESGQCDSDPTLVAVPADVVIDSLDPATGEVTWFGYSGDLPTTPRARFDSVLWSPGNLSVDAAGRTYVVDTWNSRIAVFDAEGSPLYTIGHYGTVYTVDGNPSDALIGYPVASTNPNAVCWDALGNAVTPDATQCPNSPAQLLGLFNNPNDVTVAADGTLIVADAGNHRIQLLKPDANGSVVASDGVTRFKASTFGTWALGLGVPVGAMSFPGGVAAGANGRIAVADTDNSRIEVFDPNAAGTVLASDGTKYTGFAFGSHGENADEFNYPLDIAIDPNGRLLIADSGNNQIKVYSSTGSQLLATLGSVDGGLDPGNFGYPWGVSSDSNGNILVADTFGQRVQVLNQTPSGYTVDTSVSFPTVFSPVGVATTPAGGLMVTEYENHQIVRLAPLGLTVQGAVVVSPTSTASGSQVHVTFNVQNTGLVPLTDVQPTLAGATAIACSTGGVSTATDLAVNASTTFTLCFSAGTPNTAMTVQVGATGWAGEMTVASPPKTSPEVDVLPAGAGVSLTATASSSRVQVNHTVTVTLSLKNVGSVKLTGLQVVPGTASGLALVPGSSDPLARPDLDVNGAQTVSLTFNATQAQPSQPLSFSVTANETNPDTGQLVKASASVAIEVVTDVDPPVITGVQIRGPQGESPNQFGWIQYGPAYLTVTASDSGVGLKSIGYKAITLQSGSQAFNGQSDGALVSTGFLSHGQGNTLVAFWAEDMAGNAAANGLVPGANEGVGDFCKRRPTQCVSVNVDPLPPFLDHWPVQISDDNTTATIPFNASDSQSGVWKVEMAYPQPGASIVMDPTSNSVGSLILTTPGPVVYGDVTVTDFAGFQATFRLPFQGDDKPVLRLDRTPPEAFNRLDITALGKRCAVPAANLAIPVPDLPRGVLPLTTYWCTNKVYGTDNLPGFTTEPFAPISVIPVSWGNDYDSIYDDDDSDQVHAGYHTAGRDRSGHSYGFTDHDKDHDGRHDWSCTLPHDSHSWLSDEDHDTHDHRYCTHEHDWDGRAAELQTFAFTDEYVPATGPEPTQNPNQVRLIEKVRQDGTEARVRVMAYQYRTGKVTGPLIIPEWAYKKYEWSNSHDGSLAHLTQKFEIGKGRGRQQVIAIYNASSNHTVIDDIGPSPGGHYVANGLVLLRMTTRTGTLKIEYDLDGGIRPPDTTPPTLSSQSDVTLEATGSTGAIAIFNVTASDNVDGSVRPACTPLSGAMFPLGTTKVQCSAYDAAGNHAASAFNVTVRDTKAPALTLPSAITVTATSGAGAVVSYAASALDVVSGSRAISCSPSSNSRFPVGVTHVTCSATDAAGNVARGTFDVTVTTSKNTSSGGDDDHCNDQDDGHGNDHGNDHGSDHDNGHGGGNSHH